MKKVVCQGCGGTYLHAFPERVVCPICGSPEYRSQETATTEAQEPLVEQRQPRLLTETMPRRGGLLAE